MKKILMMAVALTVTLTASAQYPDLTDEAKQLISQQKKQWKAHADSAWEVAFPIVVEEAKARASIRTLGWYALRPETG